MEIWIILFSFFLWFLTVLIEGKYFFVRLRKEKKNIEKISLCEKFLEDGVSFISGIVALLIMCFSKISSNKELFYLIFYGYFFFCLYLIFWYGIDFFRERRCLKRKQKN